MEKPAYWRMVHGRTAYIVGCGPRMNGAKPGSVSASSGRGSAATSAAVYSGFTTRPSGVVQFSAATSPPGANFDAARVHCSSETRGNSSGLWLMSSSDHRKWR